MTSSNPEWLTNTNYVDNGNIHAAVACQVEDHPLKGVTVTERLPRRILGSQCSTGRTTPVSTPTSLLDISAALEGIDPLTKFAIEELDPLTQIANENAIKAATQPYEKKRRESKPEMESWDSKKSSILTQFTTSEKISIVTSFLNDDEQVVVRTQASFEKDKVQHRLEQLDYFEEGSQKKFDVPQMEYAKRIGQLNKELVLAWNSEQRVKALKIAIQCAKMLADMNVMQFYPSKFVLITDILDVFGRLVYERLRTINYEKPGSLSSTALPKDFTADMVSELVKETCRNWFYKIASIRELVPRMYVEMAILKSYSYLTSSEFSAALLRLTGMIRGIGNPLVAIYARCYLCRVGLSVTTEWTDRKYLVENFYDYLKVYQHTFNKDMLKVLRRQNIDRATYLTLYTPALEFILQAAICDTNECVQSEILDRCQQHGNSTLILNTIMAVFKPSYISMRCLEFLSMIKLCENNGFPLHVLLRTLGLCVTVSLPPSEQRKQVLVAIWPQIVKIKVPEQYINCVEAWMQYTVQCLINREDKLNEILGHIIQTIKPIRVQDSLSTQLKSTIEKLVNNSPDIEVLLSLENFLPLVDLFQQETIKAEVCKFILLKCADEQPISDHVVINTLMYLCTVLHDSVNALTVEDEYRQIGEVICAVIRKVNYGKDFEQQLSFYVDARGALSNLYPVLAQLVQCVNFLAVKTRSIVNGHHTRKTGAFVRACAAYCFITIPSISSAKTRLELYLISGQVALFNNCLGQADSCFKTVISIIPELSSDEIFINQKNSDAYLLNYVRKFLSVLLVVPDSPDKGVLNLTRVLVNVLQNYKWEHGSNLAEAFINVLDMLSVMALDKYPYYVDKIDSNDSLYGSDQKFITEIDRLCTIILAELLNKLKDIGPSQQQSNLAVKLVIVMLNRLNLVQNSPNPSLIVNLWQLALRHKFAEAKYIIRTKDYLLRKYSTLPETSIQRQIINKLHVY